MLLPQAIWQTVSFVGRCFYGCNACIRQEKRTTGLTFHSATPVHFAIATADCAGKTKCAGKAHICVYTLQTLHFKNAKIRGTKTYSGFFVAIFT